MDLSIIITHYKTPNLLLECIQSFVVHVKNLKYEIIVVDSAAEMATQNLLEERFGANKNVHYIAFKKNVGYGYSANRGLARAKGDYMLIVNADIRLEDDKSVPLLIEYVKKHKDVGLVGPRLLNVDGTIQQSYFREPSISAILARRTVWAKTPWGKQSLARYEFHDYNGKAPLEVDWLMGSCYVTSKKAQEKVGDFDERYFMYFEDVDFAHRFRKKGFRVVYLPEARLKHFHIRSSKGEMGIFDMFSNKYTQTHIASWIKYLVKWKFPLVKS